MNKDLSASEVTFNRKQAEAIARQKDIAGRLKVSLPQLTGLTRLCDASVLTEILDAKERLDAMLDLHQLKTIVNGKALCWQTVNDLPDAYKAVWLVQFDDHMGMIDGICVTADTLSDAIDEAADYAEKMGWMGYFYSQSDITEMETEDPELPGVSWAGNHCLPYSSENCHVIQLEGKGE